jgi:hypothetical protein
MARPARWPDPGAGAASPGELLVVCGLGAAPDAHSLLAMERDWIAPALAQWLNGSFDSATLLAGERAITLKGSRWRGWWRRPRPWWELLLK